MSAANVTPQTQIQIDCDLVVDRALRNPEVFQAWLQQLSPDVVIGRSRRAYDCPIAMFLKQDQMVQALLAEKQYMLVVCQGTISLCAIGSPIETAESASTSLPSWTSFFIRAVDLRGYSSPISAALAQTIVPIAIRESQCQ